MVLSGPADKVADTLHLPAKLLGDSSAPAPGFLKVVARGQRRVDLGASSSGLGAGLGASSSGLSAGLGAHSSGLSAGSGASSSGLSAGLGASSSGLSGGLWAHSSGLGGGLGVSSSGLSAGGLARYLRRHGWLPRPGARGCGRVGRK